MLLVSKKRGSACPNPSQLTALERDLFLGLLQPGISAESIY